ncbi:MAG: hypothetical protein M3410_08230 [Acidobacteriota bacterium]|nr:hypothetical protein [Acidobacteriota bacterium]
MMDMFRHANIPKLRSRWRLLLTFMPAAGVTLLPKCPLCLIAIMSALGLGTMISVIWLKPLTIALLGVAVASLALSAHRDRGYNQSLLGLLAAVMVFVGKFYLDYPPATYGGLALLFAATVWGGRVRKRSIPSRRDCGCKSRDHTRPEAGVSVSRSGQAPLPRGENSRRSRGHALIGSGRTTLTAGKYTK